MNSTTFMILAACALLAACDGGGHGGGDADADVPPDGQDGEADVRADDRADPGPDDGADAESDDGPADIEPEEIPPPPVECTVPVEPVDVSSPDAVVGTGTPGSCTEAALDAALAGGGIIVFDCGDAPATITVTSEKTITADTVIDGGGTVTLSGGGSTRILALQSSFERNTPSLTVQRLAFSDALRDGSGEDTEDGGGAIYRLGGTLTIIDCTFTGNRCPPQGQDVAGGAVYSIGVGTTTIVGSVFTGNSCSNGGAIGNLHNQLTLVNSTVTGNSATGTGGNPGNGGNGGGIYMDGVGQTLVICGTTIAGNTGNAFGGGLFRVSNDGTGSTSIDRCTVDGNGIPDHDPSMAGGLYLQGMAISMTAATVSANSASNSGGLFIGPTSTLEMTNVTIASNTALSSLGGGMAISDDVTGTVQSCTFANNSAPGEVAFAAGTVGGAGVTFKNTVFSGQTVGNAWNPITCRDQHAEGGGNIQWPVLRDSGQSDDPDDLCTSGTLAADPLLGELADNGGPTLTLMPQPGSPAIGLGHDCPATDQRGEPRAEPCTSGAVEAP
jgi:hypothetical protein